MRNSRLLVPFTKTQREHEELGLLLPIHNLNFNYPVTVPWVWFKAFYGDGLLSFISWLCGHQVTNYEYEVYQHWAMKDEKMCHVWEGVEYHYHDRK